ncbi:MAG: PepSY-like domain-containing protein [Nitrosospira sp.]
MEAIMRTQFNGFVSARTTLLMLFLFFSHSAIAREGTEVSVNKIPVPASGYIQTHYPKAKKVKYFMETDEAGKKRYEVKLKYKGDKFDLTFDSLGEIIEVEKEIDCAIIEDAVHQKIISYFNSNFSRYHIYKCEEVASGGDNFFEIKLRGKRPEGESFFDVFFTRTGDFKEMTKEEVISLPILN